MEIDRIGMAINIGERLLVGVYHLAVELLDGPGRGESAHGPRLRQASRGEPPQTSYQPWRQLSRTVRNDSFSAFSTTAHRSHASGSIRSTIACSTRARTFTPEEYRDVLDFASVPTAVGQEVLKIDDGVDAILNLPPAPQMPVVLFTADKLAKDRRRRAGQS